MDLNKLSINDQALVNNLRAQIKAELDLCDPEVTPTVCKMKTINYTYVENVILEYVFDNEETVSSGIWMFENAFSDDIEE